MKKIMLILGGISREEVKFIYWQKDTDTGKYQS